MSPVGRENAYNKGLLVAFLCLGIFANDVTTRTMWKWNGNSTKLLSEFIVGGNTIAITKAPWQVSVRLRALEREFFGAGHICGGSLMSPRVVVSAAHCILNENSKPLTYRTPSEFVLVMGSADLYEITQYTYEYDVIDIQVNAGFNFTTMVNDIALFFIDGTVPGGLATVSPIQLNHVAEPNGTMCMVTGWGATMQNGYISSRLLGAYVPIVSNTVCASNYTGISAGMLCAGYMKLGGVDACQGDSGGPLACNNVLVGIVSWGNGCAKPGYPGVYTNITHYDAWISWANSTFDYHKVDVVYDYYGTANTVIANSKFLLGLSVLLLLLLPHGLLDTKI